ncbi:hypothetical protein OG279_14845 [Streptomyces sp. NBC_01201]|uniref:hypothetical protein n=1 Tax=Streptomyces sp. NBC_01201 TaxID=2903770 RepID=UPI002E113E52|nr:hypothetical protein OG279_14845 [Streptomyces sp. NBC_01201]
MTEPTNEKLTEDIAGIKEALGKKADNSTVEGLLKRSDVRPKALVDGPEDEAPPGRSTGSGEGATPPGTPDQQDLATQQELQEATASSLWTHVKPAELVGLAFAWQALKFELPTLFNLEIFTEKMLGRMNLFQDAEGRGFHIARNEYGLLLPTRRPANPENGGEGQPTPSDPARPPDPARPSDPARPAGQPTPADPARPAGQPARRRRRNASSPPESPPARPRTAAAQAAPRADPEQQRRLQDALRRTNDESRRAASALRDANGAAADLARTV